MPDGERYIPPHIPQGDPRLRDLIMFNPLNKNVEVSTVYSNPNRSPLRCVVPDGGTSDLVIRINALGQ
jgi:hypothetical protein